MSEDIFESSEDLCGVLQQISIQLRLSLGNIYQALEKIAPPDLRDEDGGIDSNAAVLMQSYYRILRLTDNLADAARLNGGEDDVLRLVNDDIVGLCRRLAGKSQPLAEMLGLTLDFRSDTRSHIILMDSRRIERLVMNLMSNAFKFTPAGGKITMELRINGEWVHLSLTDTGCGICEELMDTVFDRYRHSERLDPPPHGLGLGLPICRWIVQGHGGRLVLTSKEGEGTCVTVSLPNKQEEVWALEASRITIRTTFNRTLEELADALPKEAFTQKFLD